MYSSQILGTGHFLPEKTLTNADLEKLVDTSDEWIVERTGIKERHLADDDMACSDIAVTAAKQALEKSGTDPKDLDMIIFATCTPDYQLPNSACELQRKLGASTCLSWDLNAACSGFLYSYSVANQYIASGMYQKILVVGAEKLSTIVNYKDRETCILFGDGAGAMVFGRGEGEGILSEYHHADGKIADQLMLPGGGSKMPITQEVLESGTQHLTMKGRELFKSAVRTMAKCSQQVLEKAGKTLDDVQWVLPHQANKRIIEGVARQLSIPSEKIIINLEHTGNTSSASVPIALDQAIGSNQVKRGDLILMTVFGAGLTSGAILMRY